MPFGKFRGKYLVELPGFYLVWLVGLERFTVKAISERRKQRLQSELYAELQRRFDWLALEKPEQAKTVAGYFREGETLH